MFGQELLEAIRAAADLSAAADDNRKRLIGLAGAAGVSNADLVQASGLSRSAVAEITVAHVGSSRALEVPEIEVLLRSVKNVALVAAGGVGYREYRAYHAYICQANRHFNPDTERFGFYADQELKPEFPRILDFERSLTFTAETADRLRGDGRNLLAEIVDKVLSVEARGSTTPYDVYALSAPADTEHTLKLDAPIRHITSGPGTGFVQKQRYVSEYALRQSPKTTRELLGLDA